MDVRLPDGTIIKNVPDGTTKADLTAKLKANGYDVSSLEEPSFLDSAKSAVGNLAAGAVRGAGSIGATLLAPIDMAKDALAGKGLSLESNRQRRADIDAGLATMGADPESGWYQTGKIGGEIAGTLGAGPGLANALVKVAPGVASAAPSFINALSSSGMTLGRPAAATALGRVGDLGIRAAGGAVSGGVTAAMVDPESMGEGAAIGAAFPLATAAAGTGMRAVGNALRGKPISPEVASLASKADQLGIEIPADRLANSKPLNALAASLNYIPLSGRTATEAKMQTQFKQALSRTFGQNSDNISTALDQARVDLGREFDRVLQSTPVKVDMQFMQDLAAAANRAASELGGDGASVIAKQIDDIVAKGSTGVIDGQAAYNIKKTLDRIGKQNAPQAFYARDLKDALMGALNRSLGPQEAAKFATTRKQYGNMLTLENLVQNGAEGDISLARVANLKNIRNAELQDLADIAAQFMRVRESPHGAMQRVFLAGSATPMSALIAAMPVARTANVALNSQAMRNALLGNPNPGIQNALANALPLTSTAAPVLIAQ